MSWDVLVVGGGGAGLSAAIQAADRGARVLVVDAGDQLGGSTRLSNAVYYAAGTEVQREAGVEGDTADAFFQYYMTISQWQVDADIVRQLCDLAEPGLRWLQRLGIRFLARNLYASGVESTPRGHSPSGGGAAIVQALERGCLDRGVEIRRHARVTRLVRDDQSISGVEVDGELLSARSVVLATGGFGQSRELLRRWFPDADAEWTTSVAAPTSTGDGMLLGEAVGAALTGHNRGLVLPSPGRMPWDADAPTITPGWVVLVNREGRRFVDELARNAVIGGAVTAQGGVCWAVFDAASPADPLEHPVYGKQVLHPAWSPEGIARGVEHGRILLSHDIETLASSIGVPPRALRTTIDRYNTDCAAERDNWFFKAPGYLRPIATAPFYAREIRPCVVVLTGAGLRIDLDARVLDSSGEPLPGLYACGEVVGNVLGPRYIGSGNSITNCVVYGRIAGASAADHARA